MAPRPISRVIEPSRIYWPSLKTRIFEKERVMPSIGISVGSLHAMRSTQERHPGPSGRDIKST